MTSSLPPQKTEAAILARMIQARSGELSRDAAKYLLSFQFDDSDVSRMEELSELARQGLLSPAQANELDSYIHVGNLLAVMQAKARRALESSE